MTSYDDVVPSYGFEGLPQPDAVTFRTSHLPGQSYNKSPHGLGALVAARMASSGSRDGSVRMDVLVLS